MTECIWKLFYGNIEPDVKFIRMTHKLCQSLVFFLRNTFCKLLSFFYCFEFWAWYFSVQTFWTKHATFLYILNFHSALSHSAQNLFCTVLPKICEISQKPEGTRIYKAIYPKCIVYVTFGHLFLQNVFQNLSRLLHVCLICTLAKLGGPTWHRAFYVVNYDEYY